MKALILGCSHAAGSEMSHDDCYGRAHSYPMLLAQHLRYTAHNLSIPGGSNEAVFRIFTEQCDNFDMVIACWTGIDRTELWDNESHAWLPMAHGVFLQVNNRPDLDAYSRNWAVLEGTLQRGHLAKTKNILALNMLAQSKNIAVINLDSFQPVDWPDRMQWPSTMTWPVPETFCAWALQQKYTHTENGHFGRDAHSAFADYVLKNLAN
jgi:hypothetical protein